MNKTASVKKELELNLVSHSHWDREWYMSHAKHNYRLVKLIDSLLNTFETDKEFKSFHLDGQILILKDYLEIRPEKLEQVKKLIGENKLKIGAFYILQDEFLISGEFNIRNVLYGLKECEKFGKPSMTGYFPDAFGNIGQMPQIMRGFNIDNAYFGRGIIPTGYANEVLGKADEGFSEIIWRGVDGSEIIGVQFVNWYHNAYQIPTTQNECLEALNHIISSTSEVARTPHLLGMNGCDHQPVQTDLSKVLAIAKSAGINVCHTSLEDYINKIRPYKDSFYNYKGEIVGQNGTGFGTLIGTASSRIYLKLLNYYAQMLVVSKVEPIAVMASKYGIPYDSQLIYWACLKLMENHPHDSICGCGVDEIHKKMEIRFMDAIDTLESYLQDTLEKFTSKIETTADKNIIVFNSEFKQQSGVVECTIDYREDEIVPDSISILNDDDKEVPFMICSNEKAAKYILPDDRFREIFDVTRIKIKLLATTKATTFSRYKIVNKKPCEFGQLVASEFGMSNAFLSLEFNKNGTFNLTDRAVNKTIKNQNYFLETGDNGSEYEFIQCGNSFNTLEDTAKIEIIIKNNLMITFKVVNQLMQQNGENVFIESLISLEYNSKLVKIETMFKNSCTNHRVRVGFDCSFKANEVYAEGQFDIAKRKIKPGERWKNSNNPHRMSAFVMRKDSEDGCIYPQRGLSEYEVNMANNATEITLVRSIGQMGDWFYFPTIDSQCQSVIKNQMAVGIFSDKSEAEAIDNAYNYYNDTLTATASNKHSGEILEAQSLIEVNVKGTVIQSCLKKAENSDDIILRLFNPTESKSEIEFSKKVESISMSEEKQQEKPQIKKAINPKKIETYLI